MSSKRARLISLTGIVLIVLIIGVSLLVHLLSKDVRDIPLPDTTTPAGPSDTAGGSENNGLEHVAITPENVQDVIATLQRPSFYTRSVRIEKLYEGNSAIYDISTYYNSGMTALKISGTGIVEHIVIAGGKLYKWYDGDKKAYERRLDEDEKKSSDEYQMMMSYEDVLKLDKSSIVAAAYKEYSGTVGENCIYVQYMTDLLGYTVKYYISVRNGLLIYVEMYDGNTLVYKMSSSEYNPVEPDASVFDLPDGKNPVIAP